MQKFIIGFLALLIMVEPILQVSQIQKTKAQEADTAAVEEEPIADVPYDGNSTSNQPASIDSVAYKIPLKNKTTPPEIDSVIGLLAKIHSEEDRNSGIGLDEALSNQVEPRIILNGDDQQALNILWRLSGTWMMPDFEREPEAIWVQYKKFKEMLIKNDDEKGVYEQITRALGHEITSVDDIAALKVANRALYIDLSHYAQVEWTNSLGDVADAVKKQTDSAFEGKTSPDTKVIEMISDVTGETVEAINKIFADNANSTGTADVNIVKEKYNQLMDTFFENIKAVKIDIRIVNLLVYLVTPKTQGGAGHYKIKVKRILSGYTAPKKIFTRESETIYNNGNETETKADSTTAADYGQNRTSTDTNASPSPQSLNSEPNSDAVVYDQDGESYNAFVTQALAAEGDFPGTAAARDEEERNISAHADGQAVDIAEIDDIRCTMIKKRRIGSSKKSKFLQRPIKLAWQTEKGYADNGGGDLYKADMANVLKSYASDSIKDLVNEFGGDISDYDGDISSAGFSDVAMLIGKSIFAQIINSPGANLQGFKFGDTLTQLGGMYMADYLGLPREMFAQGSMPDSYDEMAQRIGTAAIEKRLDLPIGTFSGNNLQEMLQKVGQRKFEFEMNLATGALDNYFKDVATLGGIVTLENKDYLIGRAIIEQELSLPQGSFTGESNSAPNTFDELKNSLGEYKSKIVFSDPIYVDNMLHIDLGTTEKLVNGTLSPYDFCAIVGRTRLDDTVYGMQYMSAKDTSYEFAQGTLTRIIDGETDALVEIGIKMMARVFTSSDEEREAYTTWINNNLDKDPANLDACYFEEPVKVKIASGKEITITETKATEVGLNSGDMFAMFACPSANPRTVFESVGSKILRDSLIQYYLTPDEKLKFNLLEMNPTFHSSDPEKQFYVTRAYDILTILERIKANWKEGNKDPEYLRMKKVIDDAYLSIKTIVDRSMPITTISQAKVAGRSVAVAVNKLKSDASDMRMGANRYINKANATLVDINRLVQAVSEIIAGKELPRTDTLTLTQIPAYALTDSPDNTVNAPSLSSDVTPRITNSSLIGLVANKQSFMALLSRKMKPADFFLIMACDKVEVSLDLPQNSLIYFVQNYEKKGLGTIESFYSAIGQAKIEETFNMPNKYFQGPFITDPALDGHDFRNDLQMLYEYSDAKDIESKFPIKVANAGSQFRAYAEGDGLTLGPSTTFENPFADALGKPVNFDNFNDDGSANMDGLSEEQQAEINAVVRREHYVAELLWAKIHDPKLFNFFVNKAEKNYNNQIQTFYREMGITSKDLEVNIDHVILNIDRNKLTDGIRSAEQDLLFRMGISGSFDALKNGNSVAWMDASNRTNQIDKLLHIPSGSTKALFTGERINMSTGIDRISKKDKQILVAKMGISPVAIDKLLLFLSGEAPLESLNDKAIDITNVGDNTFLGSSEDKCDTASTLLTQDTDPNSSTLGQMIAGSMISNSWFYFDKTIDSRAKTFGSQIQAQNYALEHTNDQMTYIQELAYGLGKLADMDMSTGQQLAINIMDFLENKTGSAYPSSGYEAIERKMGVSIGTLNKLFTVTQATASDTPLVSYKRTVGRQVVKTTINSRIFGALGIKVDPDLFSGNEFFEIMQGNYSSLWGIAGSMIDQSLNIPRGSTMNILTAKSNDLRKCNLAEIGGSIIGRYVGLDYVSLKGNIFENIGRSKLEKTLGLPRNSFAGENIEQLIRNVGVVNFFIAYQYPIGDADANINETLSKIYDPKYVESIKAYSNEYKLRKIKEFFDINNALALNSTRQKAYNDLNAALMNQWKVTAEGGKERIDPGSDRTKDGDWRRGIWGVDKKDEVIAYLARVDLFDSTFGLRKGTTAAFIHATPETTYKIQTIACGIEEDGTPVPDPDDKGRIRWDDCNDATPGNDTINIRNADGSLRETVKAPNGTCNCNQETQPAAEVYYDYKTSQITPEMYIERISSKTLIGIAVYGVLDLFDFDMTQAQKDAVVGILTHYGNWAKGGNEGAAKLYDGLSAIFSLHLDSLAHLEEGTIKKMIENPGNIGDILIPQAARQIDQVLNIDPTAKWSISGVYARYFNSSADTTVAEATKEEDCGPEQAAIDEAERQLAIRQRSVDAWEKDHGSIVNYDTQVYSRFQTTGGYNITEQDGYQETVAERDAINTERNNLQTAKAACKANNRFGGETGENRAHTVASGAINKAIAKYCSTTTLSDVNEEMCQNITNGGNVKWKFAWIIITDFASDIISNKIFELTKNTLRMPPEDIKHFFANGDMRYFNAALISYSANTFLNSQNVNSNGEREAVPQAWQIPYEMIRLWFVGDSGSEDYAADAAAANYLGLDSPELDFDSSLSPTGIGNVSDYEDGSGGFLGMIFSQNFDIQAENANFATTTITNDQLTSFNRRQSDLIYNGGVVLDQATIDRTRADVQNVRNQASVCTEKMQAKPEGLRFPPNAAQASEEQVNCQSTIDSQIKLDADMQQARIDAKDRYRKQAQYRMMDATLWTKDHNIFPGFSSMLLEGSGKQKNIAIGLYLRNGLENGQFFGKDIEFLQKIEAETGLSALEWKFVIDFGIELAGDKPADQVLIDFQRTTGLEAVGKFISVHSEKWFGFKIDPAYGRALMVGITTGHWGLTLGNREHNVKDPRDNYKEYKFDTLGKVFADMAFDKMINKAFAWADSHTGWKPGTAYKIYDTAKQIINALNTYKKLKTYEKLLTMEGLDTDASQIYLVNNPKIGNLIKDNPEGLEGAKAAALNIIVKLVAEYATKMVMKWINSQAGQAISRFEESMGLVPGSSMILIEGVVGYAVGNACIWIANQGFGATIEFLGPGALYAALAMFVAINLFGYYKTELKCSADGYYPEIETPSIANDSNSGLGVWNGMDEGTAKAKTIAAAQYKAKRLILDALEMHNNPLYKDTYPSQIMTGRNEDVLATNDSINQNMCSVIGLVAIAGICGGNTRAGVWENLQTTTYTHIGF